MFIEELNSHYLINSVLVGGELTGLCVALSAKTPLGRQGEALSRQHLRRTVPLLLRIPWKHTAISHHSTDRQVKFLLPYKCRA